jgi:hypothetical protein
MVNLSQQEVSAAGCLRNKGTAATTGSIETSETLRRWEEWGL